MNNMAKNEPSTLDFLLLCVSFGLTAYICAKYGINILKEGNKKEHSEHIYPCNHYNDNYEGSMFDPY